jgi:hypothetical protein
LHALSRLDAGSSRQRELAKVARRELREAGFIALVSATTQSAQTMQQRVEPAPAARVIFSQDSTGSPREAAGRIDLACCRQCFKARQEDIRQCRSTVP